MKEELCSRCLGRIQIGLGREDNQFFMQALTDTAHSIDVLVIAQAIESDEERKTVESMNLDGIQGYLTGKPEAL